MTKKEEKAEELKNKFQKACNNIANGVSIRTSILDNMSMAAFNKYQIDNPKASELYSQCLVSRAGYISMLLEEVIAEEEINPQERKVKMDGYKLLLESYNRNIWGRHQTTKNEGGSEGLNALADLIKDIQGN